VSDQAEPASAPPFQGIIPQLSRTLYGDPPPPSPELEEARERAEALAAHLRKRSEFRERLETVQRTAIAFTYVVVAVLVCAMAFEVWRILHEVTP
jgi:hypothetical protein